MKYGLASPMFVALLEFSHPASNLCSRALDPAGDITSGWRIIQEIRSEVNDQERQLKADFESARSHRESARRQYAYCSNDRWRITREAQEVFEQMKTAEKALVNENIELENQERELVRTESGLESSRVRISARYSPSSQRYRESFRDLIGQSHRHFCESVLPHQEQKRIRNLKIYRQGEGYALAAELCSKFEPGAVRFVHFSRRVIQAFLSLLE